MEGVFNWLQGRSKGAFSFDLTISNPTEFDIVIEKSQVFVLKKEQLISEVNLQGFSIPAFSSRDIPIQLDTKLDTTTLTDWETIAKDWRVDLHVELFPGIPFIVNLYEAQ